MSGTQFQAKDRTGLAGLGICAVACAIVAVAMWQPLALAFSAATGAVSLGVLLVPILIGVVLYPMKTD